MKINIQSFGSMSLGIAPHLLPLDGAQEAIDVNFDKGDLRSWRKPLKIDMIETTYNSAIQYLEADEKRIIYSGKIYKCTSDTPNPAGVFSDAYWTILDAKSLFRFEANNIKHWVVTDKDRDYIRVPIASDIHERIFFSGESELRAYRNDVTSTPFNPWEDYYKVGVPAPTAACVFDTYTNGGLVFRAYYYTYTNKYGEEGAPSLPVSVEDYSSGNIVLGGFTEPPTGRALENGKIRVYRTNSAAAGIAEFQYADEFYINGFDFATGTFLDTILDENLGEVCPTEDWDVPPDGIFGVKIFKSTILCGIAGNKLCFSVPGIPHAWPDNEDYRKPIPSTPIGFGIYGSNVYVLTDDHIYTYFGEIPPDMGRSASGGKFPCASKESIFEFNEGVGFAGHEGLMLVNTSGCINLTQDTIIGIIDWQALNPESIHGKYFNGKYFFFHDVSGNKKQGMLLDLTGGNKLTKLSLQSYACNWDYIDGEFYMVLPDNNTDESNTAVYVKKWNADPYNYLTYLWKSKKNLLPNKMFFRVGKCFLETTYYSDFVTLVEENEYLAGLNADIFVTYGDDLNGEINEDAINEYEINGDRLYSLHDLSISPNVEFKLLSDNQVVHTELVDNNDLFSLSSETKGDTIEILLAGNVPVYYAAIAASATEMITS